MTRRHLSGRESMIAPLPLRGPPLPLSLRSTDGGQRSPLRTPPPRPPPLPVLAKHFVRCQVSPWLPSSLTLPPHQAAERERKKERGLTCYLLTFRLALPCHLILKRRFGIKPPALLSVALRSRYLQFRNRKRKSCPSP